MIEINPILLSPDFDKITAAGNFFKRVYLFYIVLYNNRTTMNEQDIKNLRNIALEGLKKSLNPEEALRSLMNAGILDENGNHTEPYQNLGRAVKRLNKQAPAK